jgi:hypothetical protein
VNETIFEAASKIASHAYLTFDTDANAQAALAKNNTPVRVLPILDQSFQLLPSQFEQSLMRFFVLLRGSQLSCSAAATSSPSPSLSTERRDTCVMWFFFFL